MSETDETSGGMSGPEAGLGATGRTADDFEPGDETASDYSSPGGLDREGVEEVGGSDAE